jgi:aldose 1-epimerase
MDALPAPRPQCRAVRIEGRAAFSLVAGHLQAVVVPELGCLCTSLSFGGAEFVHSRAALDEYARGDLTGIPLLFPWANRLAADGYVQAGRRVELGGNDALISRAEHGLAIHGARASALRFRARGTADERSASMCATLEQASVELLSGIYPFAYELEIEIRVDRAGLRHVTVLRALEDGVPVSFGYHPYLRLPGADRSRWTVNARARARQRPDARGLPTGRTHAPATVVGRLGTRTLDDGFLDALGPLTVAGGSHRIAVVLVEGYPVFQLWAPDPAPYVSVEPMTAETNALSTGRGLRVLRRGEQHRAEFRIAIQRHEEIASA